MQQPRRSCIGRRMLPARKHKVWCKRLFAANSNSIQLAVAVAPTDSGGDPPVVCHPESAAKLNKKPIIRKIKRKGVHFCSLTTAETCTCAKRFGAKVRQVTTKKIGQHSAAKNKLGQLFSWPRTSLSLPSGGLKWQPGWPAPSRRYQPPLRPLRTTTAGVESFALHQTGLRFATRWRTLSTVERPR